MQRKSAVIQNEPQGEVKDLDVKAAEKRCHLE
jgi:hypothetical protein